MKNNIKIDNNLKKVLIIGANGFLGTNILQFRKNKEILDQNLFLIASDLNNDNIDQEIPFYHIDITNEENTINKIIELSPQIIILLAAMTDVDQCEIDKNLATKINVEGPKNVIKACKRIESKLIFLSTDFIFEGTKENGGYREDDLAKPLSHYGKTKHEAEIAIIKSEIDYLICRSAVIYGWNKRKLNFITWVIDKLEENEKLSIITNQINSPTFVRNLAEILLELIKKDAKGIYHTAGDCILNRFEIAVKCAEIFNYNKNLLSPITTLTQKAIRPKNAGLDISKLKRKIGSEMKIYNLDNGLEYMKRHQIT
ncbi:MAG: SDR family oxidoreductase [Candidatus Lokiarchaeia archaeon]